MAKCILCKLSAHKHSFIIIALCSCLLNHIEEKRVKNKNTFMLSFLFTHVVTFTSALYFLCRYGLVSYIWFFDFNWRSPFSIFFFCRADLLGMNFLSFCIWDYLNFFFFSFITCFSFVFCSIVLTDIEFLNDSLFLSSPWLCYLTAFWPPCFLMRGQLLIHENLLYMRSYFLATFKILSLSLSFESLIMICVGVEPTWNSLSFLDVEVNFFFFNQSWEVFSYHFFRYSFCPFLSLLSSWDCHYEYIYRLDGVPKVTEALLIFFLILFFYLLLRQDIFNCLSSSLLILSSASLNLLLSPPLVKFSL